MEISERIKKRRTELGLTVDQVADALNVNRTTIYRYESKDIEKMPITVIESLAKVLNVTPHYLMGWEDKEEKQLTAEAPTNIVKILYVCRSLNDVGQKRVIDYATDLKNSGNYKAEQNTEIVYQKTNLADSDLTISEPEEPYYYDRCDLVSTDTHGLAAAGNGFYGTSEEYSTRLLPQKDRGDYDEVTVVTGDSMLPYINPGDVVFIKKQSDAESGDIAVVRYRERVYVKKIIKKDKTFILRSYNKKYQDIEIEGTDLKEFRLIGKVVDVETPISNKQVL